MLNLWKRLWATSKVQPPVLRTHGANQEIRQVVWRAQLDGHPGWVNLSIRNDRVTMLFMLGEEDK